ncbi:GntR family transcriptional regulator [Kribbella sp. NPDC004875]|uniref:GntR family transcriptional regulator n=1 Tax=Kribbella sp. NPDC004875 TaxID=3364107 RepID=UPI0036C70795
MTSTAPTSNRNHRRHPARWLRDALRSELMSGGFSGGLLPSEAQLMMTYGAPRAAVRAALDLLRGEGLVERIQGTGTLAVAPPRAAKLVEIHGFLEDGQVAIPGLSNRILAHEVVPMPRVAARRLGVPAGADCLLIEYIGYLYGQILGVYTNYIRFPEAEAVLAAPFESDWYTMLGAAGLTIGETDFLIEVLPSDELLAQVLDLEPGRPVLAFEQVIRDQQGEAYDYAILRSRGDRISLMSNAVSPHVGVRQEEAR